MNGFALGGAAEGFLASQRNDIGQQQVSNSYDLGLKRLQLEQQSQQAAQKRFEDASHDKIGSEALNTIIEAARNMKLQGANEAQIYKALGPAIEQVRTNFKLRGFDPSVSVDSRMTSALAQPSDAEIAAIMTRAKESPIAREHLQ